MEVDLRTFLDRMYAQRQRLSDREVRDMSGQLMAGVDYCHAVGILHRDLKPQNILVDKSGALKICDFGLCRAIGVPLRTYTKDIVTLWYRPPELLLGCRHYSRQVDVWSLGCIIAELVLYRPMFPGDSEIDQLYKIFKILGTPNSETFTNLKKLPNYQPTFPVWEPIDMIRLFNNKPDFIDLLKQMLVMDPTRRGDLKKVLKHR
ncbi:Cyclin-dependent kinase 1, partial [Dictyocoela roeselum]